MESISKETHLAEENYLKSFWTTATVSYLLQDSRLVPEYYRGGD